MDPLACSAVSFLTSRMLGKGKSTLCGHLLYQCGTFDTFSIENSRDEIKIARNSSMNEFSIIVSSNQSKRQNLMTVENAIHRLETPHSVCTLIDAPGNEKYRHITTAALGQADATILVIDSTADVDCTADSGQRLGSLDLAQVAYDHGIRQLIVAVTKMDDEGERLSEKQYCSLVDNVCVSMEKIGYESSTIPFVPLSGLNGDNLAHRSLVIPWYEGPSLIQALDDFERPVRESFKQLWIPILRVCHVENIGTVAIATIEAGTLDVGMSIKLLPCNVVAKVASIEMHHSTLSSAQAGDHVGFNIVGIDFDSIDIGAGCIATDADVSYSTLVDHGYL